MTERKIPVACVQLNAHDRGAFEAHLARIVARVADAGRRGARLVVLPEGTVPAYVLGPEPLDVAQLDRAREALAEAARAYGMTIVYGGAKLVDGRTYNAALVLGPGGHELGHAAKHFLWHFDRRWYAAGERLAPIETPAGRLGILVCADGRIPTIARTLVERGAEILVMPTAWVTSGRDPSALENIQADLFVPVRARENRVPFVAANKCGVELQSVAYCGKSAVVAADGSFVARAAERGETTIFGEIELGVRAPSGDASLSLGPEFDERPPSPTRARIAFTQADDPREVARFAELAAQADVDVLVARATPVARPREPAVLDVSNAPPFGAALGAAGLSFGVVGDAVCENPAGLVAARLAGLDAYVWLAGGDPAWHAPYARTRAAELRAYFIVLPRDGTRAFAVDPDGTIVAGTFGDFRLAAFPYDRARAAATVAPHTDVLLGLGAVEALRSGAALA